MTEIETVLGLAEGTLQEAIASDDAKKIEIPTGTFVDTENNTIFTNKDLLKRDDNLKEEHKKAGLEMAIKDYKRDNDFDFDGKTLELLLSASNEKVLSDAKIEPDAKILELTGDLKKLKGINEELTINIDTIKQETAVKDNQRKIQGDILESIKGDLTLTKNQILTLFQDEFQVMDEDGKRLIKKGGETLKNPDNMDPLTLADVMPKFLEQFAKKVDGGNGGGDSTNEDKAGSMAAFITEMEGKDHAVGSEEFNKEMGVRIAAKTLEG